MGSNGRFNDFINVTRRECPSFKRQNGLALFSGSSKQQQQPRHKPIKHQYNFFSPLQVGTITLYNPKAYFHSCYSCCTNWITSHLQLEFQPDQSKSGSEFKIGKVNGSFLKFHLRKKPQTSLESIQTRVKERERALARSHTPTYGSSLRRLSPKMTGCWRSRPYAKFSFLVMNLFIRISMNAYFMKR